jgi:hypothetical protein
VIPDETLIASLGVAVALGFLWRSMPTLAARWAVPGVVFGALVVMSGYLPQSYRPTFFQVALLVIGVICIAVAAYSYATRERNKAVQPAYTGVLTPENTAPKSPEPTRTTAHEKSQTVLSATEGILQRKIEIGDSGTTFNFTGPEGTPLLSFTKGYHLLIEVVDNELKVSTQVKDRSGALIAELVRNEWKIAPPPRTWDRNFNREALEVRDNTGAIVLQVRVLFDRVRLQGEWWLNGRGFRLMKNPGPEGGALMGFRKLNDPDEKPIEPMFMYPSDTNFGKLRR